MCINCLFLYFVISFKCDVYVDAENREITRNVFIDFIRSESSSVGIFIDQRLNI